jgi:hypothetical protein
LVVTPNPSGVLQAAFAPIILKHGALAGKTIVNSWLMTGASIFVLRWRLRQRALFVTLGPGTSVWKST